MKKVYWILGSTCEYKCVCATHCCRYFQQTGRSIWCQPDPVAWRLPWLPSPPSWCHERPALLLPCLCMPKSPVHLRRLVPLSVTVFACTITLKFEQGKVLLSLSQCVYVNIETLWQVLAVLRVLFFGFVCFLAVFYWFICSWALFISFNSAV